ncbi:MAG: EutP/PduV family microcompartment system protein [Desulfobacterales bacterium]|nr:EutP/PduV family microcompartment system protein [Desulfobacterales bacterium]
MKKIMFIGKSGCGKTSLTQALHGQDITYLKTQAVRYQGMVVDTPGEFAENRRFYSALMVSAAKADVIGFVQDATAGASIFPPKFASMFKKKVIGIISKTDVDGCDTERAGRFLKLAGAGTIMETSAVAGSGISGLLDFLDDDE